MYDRTDNIVSKQTEHGDYGYGYDALYRLTAAAPPAGTGLSAEAFTYDGVGNRLTSADTAVPWAYNANNELTGHDDVSYEYDVNGNMVQKIINGNVTSFVYNTEDRLARVWSGDAGTGELIAEYDYDPFGRRLWKQVGGTRIYYHYSDEGLIAEYDAAGNEIKAYGWKPDAPWSTDPLFMKQAGQFYFYHNDHLGTPQKLTDLSGAVVWSAKYESFGKATVETATVGNNLRFPGQYWDAETGLHYNWFRYYDPGMGRYLRVDPIGFLGGDVNLYVYVLNDPINWVDSSGLHGWGFFRHRFRTPPRWRYNPQPKYRSPKPEPKYRPTKPPGPEDLEVPPDDLWWQQDPDPPKPVPYNPNNPPKPKTPPGTTLYPDIGDPDEPYDPVFNPGGCI